MKKITYRKLQALGACEDQVKLFRATWPKGVVPSLASFRKAAELGMDIIWFVRALLRESPQLKACNEAAARKAYAEAVAAADKAYAKATAAADKAYVEARAPARKAYDKAYAEAEAAAGKAYDEAIAPARKAYDETLATIAWEFYKEYCK